MFKIIKENLNMDVIKRRFIEICNKTGREDLPYENDLDSWTLRDFISEAQYQSDSRIGSDYDPELRREHRLYDTFINRFKDYLTDDIKCTEKHTSEWDLI